MITRPAPKTAADYLGVALAPLFIMALVGSLVFFILEATYTGPHAHRIRWVLFWFVFASVLVSRISMEEGFARASAYGLALAWATTFMLYRFIDFVPGVLLLLGLIWWTTSKLVWDSTALESDAEPSGVGLLDAGRFIPPPPPSSTQAPAPTTRRPQAQPRSPARQQHERRWWKSQLSIQTRPHSPGLWLIRFGLVTLPLFGVGQWLLPPNNPAARERAFEWLFIHVASGIGLLLLTSFLNLRRYLRSRGIAMGSLIAFRWIRWGALLGLAVLLIATLLPRPETTFSLTAVVGRLGSRPDTSERVDPDSSGGERQGRRPQDSPSQSLPDSSTPRQTGQTPTPSPAQPSRDSNQPSPQPWNLGRWLQILIYLALALVSLAIAWRFRLQLWQGLADLIRSLRDAWSRFLHLAPHPSATPSQLPAQPRHPHWRFSDMQDPFLKGDPSQLDPKIVLRQTFAALEAWAADQGRARDPRQTPAEFVHLIQDLEPRFPSLLAPVTRAYLAAEFGPPENHILLPPETRSLWTVLRENTSAPHR